MINYNHDFTPILGAKITEIRVKENDFVIMLDNGRTLTVLLSIDIGETAIVPKAEFMCGYNNKIKKEEKDD